MARGGYSLNRTTGKDGFTLHIPSFGNREITKETKFIYYYYNINKTTATVKISQSNFHSAHLLHTLHASYGHIFCGPFFPVFSYMIELQYMNLKKTYIKSIVIGLCLKD